MGWLRLLLETRFESGQEAFYNFANTPWLRLSADLQVIEPWNPAELAGDLRGVAIPNEVLRSQGDFFSRNAFAFLAVFNLCGTKSAF